MEPWDAQEDEEMRAEGQLQYLAGAQTACPRHLLPGRRAHSRLRYAQRWPDLDAVEVGVRLLLEGDVAVLVEVLGAAPLALRLLPDAPAEETPQPCRQPPSLAVKRPARPYKTATQNRVTIGKP